MIRLSVPVRLVVIGLLTYGLLILPFTSYMQGRPMIEKLGFVPSVKVLKSVSVDQKEFTAASLVMKTMMYFGGMMEKAMEGQLNEPADLQGMSRLLHNAVKLDPYQMDAYYFAQAFLTWDAKQFKVANDLLEYGMKYRTWDWYLPYFAGFNNAFFLKDYVKAAEFYKRAGELSGQPLFKNLAGRYMQESGQTDLAIAYLTLMEKQENNLTLKKGYRERLTAFREVRRIESARDLFLRRTGKLPLSIEQLMKAGLLTPPPVDPYGGRFYLQADGKVATTSKFAFAVTTREKQNAGN